MLRFLTRPRWIGLLVITLVVSITCIRLGIWQWHRLYERRAYNAAVTRGLSKPPTELSVLMPAGAPYDPTRQAYRRVDATGVYDTTHEIVLYGRAQNGQPGNHVLTPLVLPDGRSVLVDRGWVPFSTSAPPVAGARPPPGPVTVVGVMEPSDPPGRVGVVSGRITTTTTVDVDTLSRGLPNPTMPLFLWLQSQAPGQAEGLPEPAPLPPLSEGPHQGYMLQWFAFAAIFLGGFALLVWREAREPGHVVASREPSSADAPA